MTTPSKDTPLASLPLFADIDDNTEADNPQHASLEHPARAVPPTHLKLASPPTPPKLRKPPALAPSPPRPANSHPADLDWALVAAFRNRVSNQLSEAVQARDTMSADAQRELGRSIIAELLHTTAQDDLNTGRTTWSLQEQQHMAEAIFNAVFGLGRLQPLVDADHVENIEIMGNETTLLEDTEGNLHEGPPVAETDDELIDFLAFLASHSEANERSFSEAQPRLHMRLDGGARLAASAWTTPRPVVMIRRHRLRDISLSDLVDRDALSPVAASFLTAAIKAKKTVVVAGPQNAGKTTMVRALCGELDPWERIGTFETEYELGLHEMPHRHRRIIPWEARPGSGERGLDGRAAGEITVDDLLYDSFRFNLQRYIIGEIRGREILALIKAVQSGEGSISTTHAANARSAVDKLVTCALEAGPHITEAYATRAVTEHIDLVVQLNLELQPGQSDRSARRTRYVSEIYAVEPGENGRGGTHIFRPSPSTGRAVPHVLPDPYRSLERFGFRLDDFNRDIHQ
ncbi:CpaF/VirB11 family protein [Microlunatus lacustris]